MPVTVSYDLRNADGNQRSYVRSMFERFGWRPVGGSVLRYDRGNREEDWLNDVAPALMFFRSYALAHGIEIRFFTIDTHSVARVDFSDAARPLGRQPLRGDDLSLRRPDSAQSSERRIRRFVNAAADILER